MNCQFCNKEFENKNALSNHEIRCNSNPNKIEHWIKRASDYEKKRITQNAIIAIAKSRAGKSLDEIYGKERADEIRGKLKNRNKVVDEKKEYSRRSKISKTMKENGSGGYRQNSGRGKKGWYEGYWCDSSWELAWIIYMLDRGEIFFRNHEKFEYVHNNKKHYWLPDFILENGEYVEVKGYYTEEVYSKLLYFKNKIEVYDKIKMAPILKYVTEKYGNNFIVLYDGDRYTKKCSKCDGYISNGNESGICIKCIRHPQKKEKKEKQKKVDKRKYSICKCGNKKEVGSILCIYCSNKNKRKVVDRPPYDAIVDSVKRAGYSATGKQYGVSDNTIRKWMRWHEKANNLPRYNEPPFKTWGKL